MSYEIVNYSVRGDHGRINELKTRDRYSPLEPARAESVKIPRQVFHKWREGGDYSREAINRGAAII